jgi:hypothetical protein
LQGGEHGKERKGGGEKQMELGLLGGGGEILIAGGGGGIHLGERDGIGRRRR